jgi:hypothetical protein
MIKISTLLLWRLSILISDLLGTTSIKKQKEWNSKICRNLSNKSKATWSDKGKKNATFSIFTFLYILLNTDVSFRSRYLCLKQGKRFSQQHGVIRTNCMDNLDRTNVAQVFPFLSPSLSIYMYVHLDQSNMKCFFLFGNRFWFCFLHMEFWKIRVCLLVGFSLINFVHWNSSPTPRKFPITPNWIKCSKMV